MKSNAVSARARGAQCGTFKCGVLGATSVVTRCSPRISLCSNLSDALSEAGDNISVTSMLPLQISQPWPSKR